VELNNDMPRFEGGELIDATAQFETRGRISPLRPRHLGQSALAPVFYMAAFNKQDNVTALETRPSAELSSIIIVLENAGYESEASILEQEAKSWIDKGIGMRARHVLALDYLLKVDPRLYERCTTPQTMQIIPDISV
jgi:hypothetical protein